MKQIVVTPHGLEVYEEDYNIKSLNRRVGFVERWYSGGSEGFNGVRVDDERLEVAGFLLGQGVPMESVLTHGILHQDKMYNNETALVCGAVATYSERREFWRESLNPSLWCPSMSRAKVGGTMPNRMMTIFAEESERVLDAVGKLRILR